MIRTLTIDLWKAYQRGAIATRQYPSDIGLAYVALGACGEVVELRSALRTWEPLRVRENLGHRLDMFFRRPLRPSIERTKCIIELGDVDWYLAMFCEELNVTPILIADDAILEVERSHIDALILTINSLAQDVKRFYRDTNRTAVPSHLRDSMETKISIAIFCSQVIARHLDSDLPDVLDLNLDKLAQRQGRGTIKGSGDDR